MAEIIERKVDNMKAWFVYLINGKQVGTWANNTDEAEENLKKEYGNVKMEYLGNNCYNPSIKIDEFTHKGMSAVDTMIAYGLGMMFVGLR